MQNQELLIQQAEDKYPNKDGSKAMEDFVYYISNTKGIRWKDYRLAFFKWIREDKFNKYNKTQSTKQQLFTNLINKKGELLKQLALTLLNLFELN